MLRTPGQEVRLMWPHIHGWAPRRPSQWSERRGSKAVVRGWGNGVEQAVRLARPGVTSCRVGESSGWLGNKQKDGRDVQLCFGHGELSGVSSAFSSCPLQGLPVRRSKASQ